MNFEVDFVGINEDIKDASACCFRFFSAQENRYIVGIYDGGFKTHGEALVNLLKTYYFQGYQNPCIDFVICSHSDNDHASGLVEIFDNFSVSNLIMNRPWNHAEELFQYIDDGRKTVDSLREELRQKYSMIATIEEKAIQQKTKIHNGFQGLSIYGNLTILSPSKEMYLNLLIESDRTPLAPKSESFPSFRKILETAKTIIYDIWGRDSLREGECTTAENETSIVVHGDMEEDNAFLFTGDAGIRALTASANFADSKGINLLGVTIHQIPHHGGRHNVSPSVLNRVVGPIVDKGFKPNKTAFVSVGRDSDHPRKMVTNAYIRRGAQIYEARRSSIRHGQGTPDRNGYRPIVPLEFSSQVESWE